MLGVVSSSFGTNLPINLSCFSFQMPCQLAITLCKLERRSLQFCSRYIHYSMLCSILLMVTTILKVLWKHCKQSFDLSFSVPQFIGARNTGDSEGMYEKGNPFQALFYAVPSYRVSADL